jgi:cellulose synthase/poly-beta-1,6-N-acetylglucosamine synthase-like glycosyltransferase
MKISYAIPVCNEHIELEKLLSFLLKHIDENDEIVVQCDKGNTTDNLKEHCTGDWIFQIDADELPHEFLITNLKSLLEINPTVEMFLVPRVNTVKGITQEHINKWRWNVNEKDWVNWPDYQTRIIQNSPKIQWISKVHEVIIGFSTKSLLPAEENWCLYHPKDIKRQEDQNNFYSTL